MKSTMMRVALLFTFISGCSCVLAQSAPTEEMKDDIRKMMEITGAGNLAVQMMNQMLIPMKQATPSVPEEFWTKFLGKVDANELVELTVPIYAKYFTHDEIKELLTFYQTPLGKKMIVTLPSVMQESMIAGQKWGEKIGQMVVEEMKAAGYK